MGAALERVSYGRLWMTDAVDMASAAQAAGASSAALDTFASWAGRDKCHGRRDLERWLADSKCDVPCLVRTPLEGQEAPRAQGSGGPGGLGDPRGPRAQGPAVM